MKEDFDLPDEEATEALARRAARHLPDDGTPLVLYLRGDLGAGKTTFARGMLRQLGEKGPVRSPTYGLLAEYPVPGGMVVHMDLYRLRATEELQALALADLLPGSRLWLIEWPERAEHGLPRADAQIRLEVYGAGRRAHLEAFSERGQSWLRILCADSGS
ncbi:MAG TPA: tRNA (adenosine(37)-N6)-threonylcarbamoyltransferase complex ATPase subunit type 1 TsaE [Steroidobacteraceae bacterium]|nr:tRNA (adenosine(37)-N6)-threonylcarbamoyltransferase complex ATPase subunit type 1 TsaE [Steroidobacteraceae bacterium]